MPTDRQDYFRDWYKAHHPERLPEPGERFRAFSRHNSVELLGGILTCTENRFYEIEARNAWGEYTGLKALSIHVWRFEVVE